jgi:hypothetical protein
MFRPVVRLIVFALVVAGVGIAQDVISTKAGLVYFVLGRVSIVGSGRLAIGPVNHQLHEGGSLFSEAGRAEVLLNPGTVLRIGDNTRMRMDGVELTDTRISIETGSVVVTVRQLPKLDRVEIHIGNAVVVLKSDGVYRFDVDRLDTSVPWLRVFSGQAEAYQRKEVSPEEGGVKILAKHGEAVQLQDLLVSNFDRKDTDGLQQWAEIRGAPPPVIPMPPMACYSNPTKLAEFKDYMRDCLHIPARDWTK